LAQVRQQCRHSASILCSGSQGGVGGMAFRFAPSLVSCFLLCLPGAASLQLHAGPGGKELGEEVGSNLRAADAHVAAEASQNSGKSDFLGAYADGLTSQEKVLVNPEVSKAIKQTNGLASRLVENSDALCQRRWQAKCPDGWALLGDDQCVAHASYGGACRKLQSFAGKNVAEKQAFAEDCKSPWPCEDACAEGRDYSDLCPGGWEERGGSGFCEAQDGGRTKCATSYNFAEMNIKTKQELARTCAFNWKCKASCEQDLSKPCPEDWTEVPLNPGVCVAPTTYSGICSFSVNTSHMSTAEKSAFARKCAVRFQCLGFGSAFAEQKP